MAGKPGVNGAPAPRKGKPGIQPSISEIAATRERDRAAVELALAGANLTQIADQLGWAHKSVASRAIHRSLDRHEAPSVAEYRALENARYDRLQTVLWPKALAGDLQAVDRVLRLFERRAKLNGLDQPQQFVGAFDAGSIPKDPGERAAVLISLRDRLAERLAENDDTG